MGIVQWSQYNVTMQWPQCDGHDTIVTMRGLESARWNLLDGGICLTQSARWNLSDEIYSIEESAWEKNLLNKICSMQAVWYNLLNGGICSIESARWNLLNGICLMICSKDKSVRWNLLDGICLIKSARWNLLDGICSMICTMEESALWNLLNGNGIWLMESVWWKNLLDGICLKELARWNSHNGIRTMEPHYGICTIYDTCGKKCLPFSLQLLWEVHTGYLPQSALRPRHLWKSRLMNSCLVG